MNTKPTWHTGDGLRHVKYGQTTRHDLVRLLPRRGSSGHRICLGSRVDFRTLTSLVKKSTRVAARKTELVGFKLGEACVANGCLPSTTLNSHNIYII